MAHFQNSNESTSEYPKVEFCLQHYSTFTPLTFHFPQKTYKSTTYAPKIPKAQHIPQKYPSKAQHMLIGHNDHCISHQTP